MKKEVNTLEELFRNVAVFIYSFHRKQAWTRWTNKSKDSVSHIADDVKCRLPRIAHASSREELNKPIKDFLT